MLTSSISISVDIFPTPLTDHKAIFLNMQVSTYYSPTKSSYWKLNNSLLKIKSVKIEITRLIKYFFKGKYRKIILH